MCSSRLQPNCRGVMFQQRYSPDWERNRREGNWKKIIHLRRRESDMNCGEFVESLQIEDLLRMVD